MANIDLEEVLRLHKLEEVLRLHKLWLSSKPGGKRADLRKAEMRKADLVGADLREARLEGADLARAHLEGADLRGADMEGADLQGADMRGATLAGANLRKADLRKADLEWANLVWAHLKWANLVGADLRGANLRQAYLYGAYLEGAILGWAHLKGANLKGANLEEARLEGAILEGADLRGATLEGANLEGADLRKANLKGANLKGANLKGANLEVADLREAHLEGAILEGAILEGTILEKLGQETRETRVSYGSKRRGAKALSKVEEPIKLSAFKRQYPRAFDITKDDLQGLPGGMLTPEAAQKVIESYGVSWIVTEGVYRSESQRISPEPNTVIHLNIDPSAIFPEGSEEREVLVKIGETSKRSGHPVARSTNISTVGWVRCGFFKNRTPPVILVEEIQSDYPTVRREIEDEASELSRCLGEKKETVKRVLDTIKPFTERFYEDALAVVLDIAEDSGYAVEMLTPSAKRGFDSPVWVYEKLPKSMGMKKVTDPISLPEKVHKVWRLDPTVVANRSARKVDFPFRWARHQE